MLSCISHWECVVVNLFLSSVPFLLLGIYSTGLAGNISADAYLSDCWDSGSLLRSSNPADMSARFIQCLNLTFHFAQLNVTWITDYWNRERESNLFQVFWTKNAEYTVDSDHRIRCINSAPHHSSAKHLPSIWNKLKIAMLDGFKVWLKDHLFIKHYLNLDCKNILLELGNTAEQSTFLGNAEVNSNWHIWK